MHPSVEVRRRLGLQILFDFQDAIEAIRFAAAEGFSVLELNLGNLDFGRQLARARDRARIRREARRLGITLAVHALEGPSFFIPSTRARRAAVSDLKTLLDQAADAGVKNVVMHLGFEMYYGLGRESVFPHDVFPDYYERSLGDALAELKDHARGRARLCIENVGGFRFEFGHRVMNRLLGGPLGLCLDVGHVFVLSSGKRAAELEFFRRHLRHIHHSHLHDNHGVRDEHLVPGQGRIRFLPMFRLLAATRALLVFEVRPRQAALEGREWFERSIAPRL